METRYSYLVALHFKLFYGMFLNLKSAELSELQHFVDLNSFLGPFGLLQGAGIVVFLSIQLIHKDNLS